MEQLNWKYDDMGWKHEVFRQMGAKAVRVVVQRRVAADRPIVLTLRAIYRTKARNEVFEGLNVKADLEMVMMPECFRECFSEWHDLNATSVTMVDVLCWLFVKLEEYGYSVSETQIMESGAWTEHEMRSALSKTWEIYARKKQSMLVEMNARHDAEREAVTSKEWHFLKV